MMDIGQILGFLSLLIFFVVVIFVVIKPFLIRFAVRDLLQFNPFTLLIILFLAVANIFISFVLIFNASYNAVVDQRINANLGNIDGIIYSRDRNQYYSISEINRVYNSVASYFEKYLPIVLEEVDFNNEKIILTGFDENIAQSFEPKININQINTLKNNEIIIPQNFSRDANIQIGDTLIVRLREEEQSFVVKYIVENNGVFGFTNPRNSRLQEFKSNFLVSKDFIDEKYQNDRYNAILVKSSNILLNNYESQINRELANFDGNLVFEELKNNYRDKLNGGNVVFNISQLILIAFATPIATILVFVLLLFNFKIRNSTKYIAIIKTFGTTRLDLILIVFLEGLIYSLISSILGFITSIFLAEFLKKLLINYFFIENPIVTNLEFIYDWNSAVVSISSSFIIFSLIILFGILQIPFIVSGFDLAKNRYIKVIQEFKLKDSTWLLMGLFGTVVLAYYLFTGYIENNEIRNFLTLLVIQFFVWLLSYMISKFNNKFSFRILILNCIFTFALNLAILELDVFRPILSKYPVLMTVPIILIIIASVLFLVYFPTKLKSSIVGLSAPFKLIYKNVVLSTLTLIFIISSIIIVGLLDFFSNSIDKSLNDTNFIYDIIATDGFGLANSVEFKDELMKHPEIEYVYIDNYLKFTFVDKTYENSGLSEVANARGIDPKTNIQGVISTLDFNNIKGRVKFQENLSNPLEKFSQNHDYVVLGKDFIQQENGIHPKINLGEKVRIKFEKGPVIERIVIGVLEDNFENFSGSGLFISISDYLYLRNHYKIYFSTLYGIRLHSGINVDDFEAKLKSKFSNNLNSIIQPAKNIGGSTRFILQTLQLIRFYLITLISISLLLFIIMSYVTVVRDINLHIIDIGNAIKIALFSQSVLVFISFFLGTFFLEYVGQKLLKTLDLNFVYNFNVYDLVQNLILQVLLIFLSFTVFFVAIKIKNESKNSQKYRF